MEIINLIGQLLSGSYAFVENYWLSIIIFTLITRIILIPLSIWVHKHSIKLIKMQPEINEIKTKYFKDNERINEEQNKLFKNYKYNPFASILPLIIQIILLLIVIQVIYNPIDYLLNFSNAAKEEIVSIALDNSNINQESSSYQIEVINFVKDEDNYHLFGESLTDEVAAIKELNTNILGINLFLTPGIKVSYLLIIPLLAALSSWLLCFTQNKANVLQSEQSKYNKYSTMILSVGLSLYLGIFVPAAVGFYWIAGNLIAIIQMYILNYIISPKKHIDYERLNNSREKLKQLNQITKNNSDKNKKSKAYKKKEKEDYKKFFSVANKKIVFYSESNGYYKYFEEIINQLIKKSNIVIHYVTSDPKDNIFKLAKENNQIKAYYINNNKLITMFLKMDSEMVFMTMPDLDSFHIKRSYVKKDIEYVFIQHGIGSDNLLMREHSLDSFDTIIASGKYQIDEAKATEKEYNLQKRKYVTGGSPVIDSMINSYSKMQKASNKKPIIMIAPSWQHDNIIDLCIDDIIDNLNDKGYKLIIRPHPHYIKLYEERINAIKEKYKEKICDDLIIQTDFSDTESVYKSDILITDWSGIGYEFSLSTLKPTIFINTPMKVINPAWERIKVEPIDFQWRKEMGVSIDVDKINNIAKEVNHIIKNKKKYENDILKIRKENLFNIGKSGDYIADCILDSLVKNNNKKGKKDEQ